MRTLLEQLSRALALAGGVVLVAIALLSTASILGRFVLSQPLRGDVELVQTGCAVAIALFLPLSQLDGAHIIVDFFTSRASARSRRVLDGIGAAALGVVMLVLAWRAAVGVIEMREAGETTMVLGFPFWITYLFMVPGLTLAGIVGCYNAWEHWSGASAAASDDRADRAEGGR